MKTQVKTNQRGVVLCLDGIKEGEEEYSDMKYWGDVVQLDFSTSFIYVLFC